MSSNPTDEKWSWVIALSCCFINCLLYGVTRLSGLLLVATVETFQVTRARAALPFSVCTSVRNLSGIFVGYFGQKFGLRPVICAGCILASIGSGLCFFVTDIFYMIIFWGVIFGIGCGLATCLLPLAINQHFDKHRGTASGISYSGGYIGSFIFPPVIVQLLDNYGLSGTFLVISSALLNGLAASLLFKSPSSKSGKVCHLETHNASNTNLMKSKLRFAPNIEACDHGKTIWHKLSRHVKLTDAFLKTKELTKTQEWPSVYLIAAAPLKDSNEKLRDCRLPVSAESITNYADTDREKFVSETNILPCVPADSKSTGGRLPKQFTKTARSHSQNFTFKRKIKTEYKTSIAKLRRTVLMHFVRKHYSFRTDAQTIPENDVELLSFKNLNCILCSTLMSKIIHSKSGLYIHNNNDIFKGNLFESQEVQESDYIDVNTENQQNVENRVNFTPETLNNKNGLCIKTQFSNNRNSKSEEFNSHNRGNCNRIISRHNQYNVSFLPSGTPPLRKLCHADYKSNECAKNSFNRSNSSQTRTSWRKDLTKCCFGWFRMYGDPMFVIVASTMSLHTFVVVCMITIIEDFAKDLHVPHNQVHYVLMALSTADLIGALTMGIVTDRGIMSRSCFIVLCFFGTGVTIIAISFSQNLTTLLTLIAFYGLFETGVIITFPLLIAQFIEVRKQAIALASSNVLSSPTVLLVPLIIGYFRDRIGCYSGVFNVLGVTSFISSIIWLVAPYLVSKYRRQNGFCQHTSCC